MEKVFVHNIFTPYTKSMEKLTDKNGVVHKIYNENGTILDLTECINCSQEMMYSLDGDTRCWFCKEYYCRYCDNNIGNSKHRIIHFGRVMLERPNHKYLCNSCYWKYKNKPPLNMVKLAHKEGWIK